MLTFTRTAGAIGLACFVANAALASPLFSFAEWMEPCSLPSVTAQSRTDASIQLVSDKEPVAEASSNQSCDDCSSCQMSTMCCCEPSCYVSAGAIFLHRSRPDQEALITPIGASGAIVNGGDFGYGWDAGPDTTISKRMANGTIWERRYFNDRDANATNSYPGVTGVHLLGVNVLGVTSLRANADTTLDSSELNIREPLGDRCSFLAGFRWIELHDRLGYTFNNGVLTTNWNDNNHLYGGQIGSNLDLWPGCSPLRINATLKAGAYANVADNNFRANGIYANSNASDTELAFVGEVGFSASYQLTTHVAIRGGYEVLWLDNLSLATNNAAFAAAAGSTAASIDTSNTLVYNGATAAVDFVW
jgi:hypothetical protein